MNPTLLLLPLAAAAATFAPGDECSSKSAPAAKLASYSGEKSIVATAVEAGSFGTLAAALKAADLVGALEGDGPFTVFAPTDDAFAALPEGTVDTLLKPENKALLTSILTYHVVPGRLESKSVVRQDGAVSLNGQRIDFSVNDGGVFADGAQVTKTDIACTNGIIHVIDKVILPSDRDLIETAMDAGSFGTLAAALKAGHLVEALKGEGPFTVLAPTDEAFAALPKGTVDNLLKPENRDQLQAILKLHVVPGRIFARDAVTAGRAATLNGQELAFGIRDGRMTVGSATITGTDIEATNGVIHVIDSVLLPE